MLLKNLHSSLGIHILSKYSSKITAYIRLWHTWQCMLPQVHAQHTNPETKHHTKHEQLQLFAPWNPKNNPLDVCLNQNAHSSLTQTHHSGVTHRCSGLLRTTSIQTPPRGHHPGHLQLSLPMQTSKATHDAWTCDCTNFHFPYRHHQKRLSSGQYPTWPCLYCEPIICMPALFTQALQTSTVSSPRNQWTK